MKIGYGSCSSRTDLLRHRLPGLFVIPIKAGHNQFSTHCRFYRRTTRAPVHHRRSGGDAAYGYICAAANMALSRRVGAMATAPISKSILQLAGHNYPGHTELLAGDRRHARMPHDADRERAAGRARDRPHCVQQGLIGAKRPVHSQHDRTDASRAARAVRNKAAAHCGCSAEPARRGRRNFWR